MKSSKSPECSNVSQNHCITDDNHVIYLEIIEGKFTESFHIFVVCQIGKQTIRTTPSRKTNRPVFNVHAGPIPSTLEILFTTLKLTKIGKRPVVLGTCLFHTTVLGIDIPVDDWFPIKNNKIVVGSLHLRLTRSALSPPPRLKRFNDSWTALKTLKNMTFPHHSSLDRTSFFQTKPQHTNSSSLHGLFHAVCIIQHTSITADLMLYYKTQSHPETNITKIPLSGTLAEVFPENYNLLPQNLWLFCFPNGIQLSLKKQQTSIQPFVMTDANGDRKYVSF
ncbi:hypothetical protein QTN25_001827 [Entamoeba marina]